jgi:hypothetical protein
MSVEDFLKELKQNETNPAQPVPPIGIGGAIMLDVVKISGTGLIALQRISSRKSLADFCRWIVSSCSLATNNVKNPQRSWVTSPFNYCWIQSAKLETYLAQHPESLNTLQTNSWVTL